MRKFQYFSHPAEAGFKAFGKTAKEAFSNAVLAMTNMLTPISKIKSRKEAAIKITSTSLPNLLVDFLNEILYILDTKKLLIAKIKKLNIIEKNKKFILTAKALGDNAKNYKTHGDIKAVTYHQLKIEKKGGKWTAQAVVDV